MNIDAENLLKRFCKYVQVDTKSDETSTSYPSTAGQWELGTIILKELKEIGLENVRQDEHAIVYGDLPANGSTAAPTVAFFAHFDTSPETSGTNVRPIVHRDYDLTPIPLPSAPELILDPAVEEHLGAMKGKTIITSDGTTLLGSDDKSGIAVIMEAVATLKANPEIKHGPIKVVFTCDEEIGNGVAHIDVPALGAVAGYTLDGHGQGILSDETFSADLAIVEVQGVNVHPGAATDIMINAMRAAGTFLESLPRELSPERTAERAGFLHPYKIDGGVDRVTIRILLRDFDTSKLADHATLLMSAAKNVEQEYPGCSVTVDVSRQYRNMAEGLAREPRAADLAERAMADCGLSPVREVIRGGTDGSQFTELGLPTPNLATGQHHVHSPLEWTCLEEMVKATEVTIRLCELWGNERIG